MSLFITILMWVGAVGIVGLLILSYVQITMLRVILAHGPALVVCRASRDELLEALVNIMKVVSTIDGEAANAITKIAEAEIARARKLIDNTSLHR